MSVSLEVTSPEKKVLEHDHCLVPFFFKHHSCFVVRYWVEESPVSRKAPAPSDAVLCGQEDGHRGLDVGLGSFWLAFQFVCQSCPGSLL